MKAIRYNSRRREDRLFNTTGREKNPLNIKFYASNEAYAEKYRYIYNEDGDVWYECEREEREIEGVNLFDMEGGALSLGTFSTIFNNEVKEQLNHYKEMLAKSKTKKDIIRWEKNINELLMNGKQRFFNTSLGREFQNLSDYENQIILVNELRAMGFDGYYTKNEIALF